MRLFPRQGFTDGFPCPLWVNNGYRGELRECPLYPPKRAFRAVGECQRQHAPIFDVKRIAFDIDVVLRRQARGDISGIGGDRRHRNPLAARTGFHLLQIEVRDLGSAFLTSQWRNDRHSPGVDLVDLSERVRRRM